MAASDSTVVVLVPESGDGIQVMKAGLMEIADVFVVNKADRPGADRIRQDLEVAMGMRSGQVYRHVGAHHGAPTHGRTGAPEGGRDRGPGGASPPQPGRAPAWEPPVVPTVASEGRGTEDVVAALDRHFAHLEASGQLAERRRVRLQTRTREVVERAVRRWLWSEGQPEELQAALREVAAGVKTPYDAAAAIVARLQGSEAYERD